MQIKNLVFKQELRRMEVGEQKIAVSVDKIKFKDIKDNNAGGYLVKFVLNHLREGSVLKKLLGEDAKRFIEILKECENGMTELLRHSKIMRFNGF